MYPKIHCFVLLATILTTGAGCSAKSPTFYPNEHLKLVGREQADRDVADCQTLADQYVSEPDKFTEIAKSTAIAGGVGAAGGAVAGAIFSNAGRGTAAGAAAGAVVALLHGLIDSNEPSPTRERFVEYCLQKKGYEVIGWN